MHGLRIDTDSSFLVGRTLDEVRGDAHQLRLGFDENVGIAIECDCEVNGARVPMPELSRALSTFVGHAIRSWHHAGAGAVRLVFDDDGVLTLLDANEDAESFNITWSGGTLVV